MKIKEIKIINQDESTEVASIGADAINVDYNDTTVKAELDKLNNENSINKNNITNLQSGLNITNSNLDLQTSRINNLAHLDEGSTTGDAELIDARTDYLGNIFSSLGEHLRRNDEFTEYKKHYLINYPTGADNNLYSDTYIRYDTGAETEWVSIPGTFFSTRYIDLYKSSYIIVGDCFSDSVVDLSGLAFYDSKKTYISGIQYKSSTFPRAEYKYKKIEVPVNAAFIRLTVKGANKKKAYICLEKDNNDSLKLDLANETIRGEDFWNKYNYDLNNLPDNKIFTFFGTSQTESENVLNLPPNADGGGIIITIKQETSYWNDIGKWQLFFSAKGLIYIRAYWWPYDPRWGNWTACPEYDLSTYLHHSAKIYQTNNNNMQEIDYNINNLVPNTINIIDANIQYPVDNLPPTRKSGDHNRSFSGVIMDLKGENNLGRIQIAYTLNNTEWTLSAYNPGLYYRMYWGGTFGDTWTDWRYLPTYEEIQTMISKIPLEKPQVWKTFRRVGCIGDSLASGEVSGVGDLYDRSWGQYMASASGGTYYNFSKGGLEAKTWLTDTKGAALAFDGQHKCQIYIIGLGVNDSGRGRTIGTIEDVNTTDYTQNPDTYYGNMGRIIMMCQEHCPGCKIFLLTIPEQSASSNFNTAIKTLANTFDYCYLVDLAGNYADKYSNGMIKNLRFSGHWPSMGYYIMSEIIEEAINDVILEHYMDFQYIDSITY